MANNERPETITEQVQNQEKTHWLIRLPVEFVTSLPKAFKFSVNYVFRILTMTILFVLSVFIMDYWFVQQASDWYVFMIIWTPLFSISIVVELFFVTKYRAMEITRKYIGSYYATYVLLIFLVVPWLFQWWYDLEIMLTHTRWFVVLIPVIIDQAETIGGFIVGNRALVNEEIVSRAKEWGS